MNIDDYFDKLIKEHELEYLKAIDSKVKEIWREIIQEYVYDLYEPTYYADGNGNRTEQLRNKVTSKFENGKLFVYADIDNMEYYSFMNKNKPVNTELIVHIIDTGHDVESPYNGGIDYFNHYPARGFIQKFAEKVKKIYPELEVQAFRDTPNI